MSEYVVEPDSQSSVLRIFIAQYIDYLVSDYSIKWAAGLGVISTFLTAIMIPVMVGTIVYQAVSGNIIDYPTQHLIGVAAGILVATIVFWLVAGLVVAAARTLASTLFEEAEGGDGDAE
ncbi:hypothetical protein HWV23_02315 [Natronomonas halophila]|uniref:hypothetical protein n=1 Tax=Natronomonas halophila TaxID=2747817 RepID=UPI0015B5457D|nr:hypothetical protein [Natronomonas halophila]QLD84590.1 hypothetical protein HWV23_02315 [Natronomonas halophila]